MAKASKVKKTAEPKTVKAAETKPVKATETKPAKVAETKTVKATETKPAKVAETIAEKKEKAESKATVAKAHLLTLPNSLPVRELADILHVNAIDVIKHLMRNGIMANINQVINYEAAAAIASTHGFEPRLKPRSAAREDTLQEIRKHKQLKGIGATNLQPRPPVVTVMGHVDHGKTRLLDAIRQTNVMDKEAGAITQHIGAYQATVNNQKITFLDTPGHEAFTAMRAHGAQITDIIILVIAADDGVMPQTVEAINHARAAGVPIVVAINKIDKPNANVDRVKQQLADAGLVIEEWGGDVVSVSISAREKIGIEDLLENLLLVAEMEELKADPTQPAAGVVIEAEMDKSRGPLATVLVQNGTLKNGDTVVVGTSWGRVRAMFNDLGKRVRKAEPASPVELLGLNNVAEVGDILTAVASEREAQLLVLKRKKERKQEAPSVSLSNIYDQITAGKIQELNLILKTDVQGSLEPIRNSLERLAAEEIKVRMIHSGTGNITESDVMLAIASKGLIVGFSVTADEGARRLAGTKSVDIRLYDVIYSLINDVEKALKGMLAPTMVEVIEGKAEVRALFPGSKGVKVAGVYVTEGKVRRGASVRVRRADALLADSTVNSLKRFKDDVREVATGYECGVGIKDFNDFEVGDTLEFYTLTEKK